VDAGDPAAVRRTLGFGVCRGVRITGSSCFGWSVGCAFGLCWSFAVHRLRAIVACAVCCSFAVRRLRPIGIAFGAFAGRFAVRGARVGAAFIWAGQPAAAV
jgi:hypothetical protein